jgi:16S rRNA (cytosine967-C5)-methyltransferase
MRSEVSASRAAAFEVLMRVITQNSFASNMLATSKYDKLAREDRALLQELTLGVLRWQGRLDFLIERYTQREIDKLDLEAVIAMRLGLYQLMYLTRVPAFAAINESVNLVKENGKARAAGLVNGVLRSAQRELQSNILPGSKSPVHRISIEASHPVWLVKRWLSRLGESETRELAMANNIPPKISFRFNSKRNPIAETTEALTLKDIEIRPSRLTPDAFVIEHGNLLAKSEPVQKGWLYLQDEASQLIARLALQLVAENQQAKILDLCAAPGSKSSLMASGLSTDSVIVAADLHYHRLRTVKELSARLGVENINPIRLNAEQDLPFATETFDLILLDAPCSGLGTLQRNPEIKWRMNEAKLVELAELQKRLLIKAAEQVKPGGLLLYSVCSTEPEEGEEVIAWFRRQNSSYSDITREAVGELKTDNKPTLTTTVGARTFTHRHGSECFFLCVLRKEDSQKI